MLTFLLQIIILIRDINRKVKLSVVARLARIIELLVVVTLVNIAELIWQELQTNAFELLDDTTKNVSFAFVAYFRFHFLVLARGSNKVWRHQKLEMVYYMLLVTHAVPFIIVSYTTGIHLDHVQGLWMRVTIALCLFSTARSKAANAESRLGGSSRGAQGATTLTTRVLGEASPG